MATDSHTTIPIPTGPIVATIATPAPEINEPAYAAIEAHQKAEADFMEALDHLAAVEKSVGCGVSHPTLAAAHEREAVTGTAADAAAMELAATHPTTLVGAVAVLDYVATYAETSRELPEDFATLFYRTLGNALACIAQAPGLGVSRD